VKNGDTLRAHITTALELLGGLLVIAAAALWAAAVALPLALAVAGVGMVAFSWLLSNPTAPARARAALAGRVRAAAARRAARRAVAGTRDQEVPA
jgi:hypothetical protein